MFKNHNEELSHMFDQLKDILNAAHPLVELMPDSALKRSFAGFYEDTIDELAFLDTMNEDILKKEGKKNNALLPHQSAVGTANNCPVSADYDC